MRHAAVQVTDADPAQSQSLRYPDRDGGLATAEIAVDHDGSVAGHRALLPQ
jgi:hypothetical protein